MSSEYLKKPVLERKIEQTDYEGLRVTSCEMQGWRRNMEDAQVHLQLEPGVHLLAVFDGHGGPEVARYAAHHLPKELLNEPYFKLRNYAKALSQVFRRIDDLLFSERGEQDLKSLHLQADTSKLAPGQKINHRTGTTAVVMLVTKDRIYVANIGDSRAVLCRGGKAVPLSTDHKPDLPTEHNRIERAGGFVNEGRINGGLNLSRAFGDFDYKKHGKGSYEEQCVISLPEITETVRREEDQFVLLGCDGVWERYVSNSQKMVQLLSQLLEKQKSGSGALDKLFGQLVAKDSKDTAGFDNMTALLLEFC